MSRKKYLYGALGLGALTLVALPIFAGGKYFGHGHKHGHGEHMMMSDKMIDRLSHRLDLQDAQRDSLYAAADEVRPQVREFRRQLLESRNALRDLNPNAEDYHEQVAALADKHGAMAREATTLVAGMKSTLAEVLDDAQMTKLMGMLERKRGRHKWHD